MFSAISQAKYWIALNAFAILRKIFLRRTAFNLDLNSCSCFIVLHFLCLIVLACWDFVAIEISAFSFAKLCKFFFLLKYSWRSTAREGRGRVGSCILMELDFDINVLISHSFSYYGKAFIDMTTAITVCPFGTTDHGTGSLTFNQ